MQRNLFAFAFLPAARAACLGLVVAGFSGMASRPAAAQAIVVAVNGDPVTTYDVEQRMKLLRAMHRPAGRDAAIESMVEDRLKMREALRYGIVIKDDEISDEIQAEAKKYKMSTTQLAGEITKAGVSQEHARNHFKAQFGYSILIKAMNRGVEASEIAVRDEMQKEKGKSSITSYTIRQVVFTINPGDGPEVVNSSVKEAEALRGRFTSCATGIPYAKTLPGVAVREKLTRTSTQLNDGIKDVLDKMPIGHLTQPSRSANGIELIALCERSAANDTEELRKSISERILAAHMDAEIQSKYKEMREHAVIEKH